MRSPEHVCYNYTERAEMQYEQVTRRDWERTALYLAGGMLLIMTAAIFLFAINRVIGVILWLALIGVVLAILVNWHTKMYAYKCKRCGEEFAHRLRVSGFE